MEAHEEKGEIIPCLHTHLLPNNAAKDLIERRRLAGRVKRANPIKLGAKLNESLDSFSLSFPAASRFERRQLS